MFLLENLLAVLQLVLLELFWPPQWSKLMESALVFPLAPVHDLILPPPMSLLPVQLEVPVDRDHAVEVSERLQLFPSSAYA